MSKPNTVAGDCTPEHATRQETRPSVQRVDYRNTRAWFTALVTLYGDEFTEVNARRICREQGVRWFGPGYTRAVRAGRSAPGETGPQLNDMKAADYLNLAEWVDAVVAADPLVTVEHVRELAAAQGKKGEIGGAYSVAVRAWREAHALLPLPRGGHNAPRPACWTEAMGDDPKAWPAPRMRLLPSVDDLQVELQTARQEVSRLRQATMTCESALAAAQNTLHTRSEAWEGREERLKAALDEAKSPEITRANAKLSQLQVEVAELTHLLEKEQQIRQAAERLLTTMREDLNASEYHVLELLTELEEAVERPEPAPQSPEEALLIGRKVHALCRTLGPDTSWERVAEILKIFL